MLMFVYASHVFTYKYPCEMLYDESSGKTYISAGRLNDPKSSTDPLTKRPEMCSRKMINDVVHTYTHTHIKRDVI